MTTILTINAVSLLLVSTGLGGLLLRRARRVRRAAQVEAVYVNSTTGRQDPRA